MRNRRRPFPVLAKLHELASKGDKETTRKNHPVLVVLVLTRRKTPRPPPIPADVRYEYWYLVPACRNTYRLVRTREYTVNDLRGFSHMYK